MLLEFLLEILFFILDLLKFCLSLVIDNSFAFALFLFFAHVLGLTRSEYRVVDEPWNVSVQSSHLSFVHLFAGVAIKACFDTSLVHVWMIQLGHLLPASSKASGVCTLRLANVVKEVIIRPLRLRT